MVRKIIFSLLVLVSAALIIFYLYDQSTEETIQEQVLLSPIPKDVVAVVEAQDAVNSWRKIRTGNLLYEELLSANVLSSFDSIWTNLDSSFSQSEDWKMILQDKTVTYSLHPLGKNFSYLISSSFGQNISEKVLRGQLESVLSGNITWSKKEHEGADIQIITRNSEASYCSYYKSNFLWSPSSIILESAIRTINSESSILELEEFNAVKKTASKEKKIHAFIDYKTLPEISTNYLKIVDPRILRHELGGWAELDLSTKPNSILLNGFMSCPDSLNYFLHCFDGQEASSISLTEIMPSHLAWFMHAGISDQDLYYRKSLSYWSQLATSRKTLKELESFNAETGYNPMKMRALSVEEVALGIMESLDENLESDYCIYLKVDDEVEAVGILDAALKVFEENPSFKVKNSEYRSYSNWHFGETNLIEMCFGPLFYMINKPVFTMVEDYVIISNSIKTNKNIVNKYLSDQTLAKDIHYNNFMSNTADESNLTFYTNIARSPNYFKNALNDSADEFIDDKLDVFRQFQAVSLQFEKAKNGKYYQTFYCKYNPVYKNETSSLWELLLDTSMSALPHTVINHNTKQQELFIQDGRNDIYLISNTGKILWKNKFEEKIIGAPIQVDKYQNSKLQMMLLTENNIHLLDRNGKTVEGFPIALESKATSGLSLMDYDNNARFRILVGCENGLIYNYNINGEAVDGWEFKTGPSPIVGRFKHFKIGTKDFILSNDALGNMKIINRKGEVRYEVSDELIVNGEYGIVKRKDISETGILHADSIGNIRLTELNGNFSNIIDGKHEKIYFTEILGNSKVVALDEDEIIIYNDKGELKAEFEVEEGIRDIQIHQKNNENAILISGTTKDDLVYIYNQDGMLLSGFPLTGSSYRNIVDINGDGFQDLIIGDFNGNLYTYTLDF